VKIRMRIDQTGTRTGEWEPGIVATRDWPPRGSVLELPDAEAAHYCQVGMAEPVTTFRDAETATTPPAEERTTPLTTDTGPAHRGPGRPRKQAQPQGGEQS
jgi:hypothetical protein